MQAGEVLYGCGLRECGCVLCLRSAAATHRHPAMPRQDVPSGRMPSPYSSAPAYLAARRDSKVRKCCEQDSQGRACTKKRRGIFQADTCSTQADANSIQALPADILLHIFAFTHPKAQREVLPLVCRQWQEVLQGPVALWRHLELDFPAAMDLGLDGSSLAPSRSFQARMAAVLTWLAPRSAAVRSLRLRASDSNGRKDLVSPVSWAQFVPLLNNITNEHDRQLVARKMQPLLMAAWAEPDYPHVQHDYTRDALAQLLGPVKLALEELVIERCSDFLSMGTLHFSPLASVSRLRVLSLKSIQFTITDRDFDAIAGLEELQEIVLDCDQPPEGQGQTDEAKWGLLHFPEAMKQLTNMTHLTLSCHYGITALPQGISRLDKLEVLNLDFCTLSELPPSLGQLTALTTLDVEGNPYLGDTFRPDHLAMPSAFPTQLSGLQALKYINLNSCGLTSVPEVLSTLSTLETLDLEDNLLGGGEQGDVAFPPGIAGLSRLQWLNIARCELQQVPHLVERLSALRILDLTNNRITNAGLPSGLARLPYLKSIGLKRNCLTSVPRMLGQMHSLQEIYLEDNNELEVTEPIRFLMDLPQLNVVMMGKQEPNSSWMPQSTIFLVDLAVQLKLRDPTKDVLRLSALGLGLPLT
ncbi:hypothetical protein ABBQ32_006503 [Trebouxia sp. C0010 RCD-2024]